MRTNPISVGWKLVAHDLLVGSICRRIFIAQQFPLCKFGGVNVRRLALILIVLAAAFCAVAAETNYACVVCGRAPLAGRIWISQWGAVCDACYGSAENRCALCGLPVRAGDGHVKTGDGRLICKFDKRNAVLEVDAAREIFAAARGDLTSLFGPGFALKFSEVTVNLFDVDYWSEKGRGDGLHKFGFSSTRKSKSGQCTHEVVMLSGQLRDDLAATAAHEYTHLWINENLPTGRVIEGDTIEGICELAAHELMDLRKLRGQQGKIVKNPYTHGVITKLLEVEREHGFRFVLNWVKEGATANFEGAAAARIAPVKIPLLTFTNRPPPLPVALKLGGLLFDGQSRHAILNGVSFAAGETRTLKLQRGAVSVRCREIHRDEAVLDVEDVTAPVTLKIGEEKFRP